MARLPTPGSDDNQWGDILNDYLGVEHNPDGTQKPLSQSKITNLTTDLAAKADDADVIHDTGNETVGGVKTLTASPLVPTPTTPTAAANKAYVDSAAATGTPDATPLLKGKLKLAGDLAGTADLPTVPALATKADSSALAAHTSDTSNPHAVTKAQVGLGNADNTSDASKPVSTATQTAINAKVADTITDGTTTIAPSQNAVFDALALKQNSLGYTAENVANKDTDGTLAANSDTKYPSQKAAKTYIDAGLAAKANDANVVHTSGTETIAGAKTFSSTIAGSISGNAATVTTNANLTGDVTSSGNVATLANTANVQTVVRTNRLDQMATPTAAVALGNQKITGLANGTVATDAAAFGQIPTGLPPSGAAGGVLAGSYPNPGFAADMATQAELDAVDNASAKKANNLSDLASIPTARTNLGLAIGTNVQAWDTDLDTWATKTAPSGTIVGTTDTQTLTNKTLTTPVITLLLSVQTTSYTLVLADQGTVVEMTSASALIVTLPLNSSVAFPIGTVIEIARMGTGTVTLAATGGVTIRARGGLLSIGAQYGSAALRKRATDEWVLVGDLI